MARRIAGFGLLVVGAFFTAAACGGDGNGSSEGASGGAGGTGGRVGSDAGTSADGGSGDTGAGGSGAADSGGTGGGTTDPGGLGSECTEDADCLDELTCLRSDSGDLGGGGPASGYCTLECGGDTADVHAECTAVDPDARCVDFGLLFPAPYCMKGCSVGPVASAADKCFGREDVACYLLGDDGSAQCVPLCSSDAQCDDGWRCDPYLGLCVDAGISGGRNGDVCDSDADCASGLCIAGSSTATRGMCVELCVAGAPGCGWDGSGPMPGLCFALDIDSGVTGDLGQCYRLCDCNDDCGHPDFYCTPWAEMRRETGREGLCVSYPVETAYPELPCGGGGAGTGGSGGAGGGGGATMAGAAGASSGGAAPGGTAGAGGSGDGPPTAGTAGSSGSAPAPPGAG